MRLFSSWRVVVLVGLFVPTVVSAYPTARSQAAMAHDKEAKRTVLFGGVTKADSSRVRHELADTWEWNGTRWIRRYPAESPSRRAGAAMVYDSAGSRIVLFGGGAQTDVFNDTWVYDAGNWSELPAAAAPPARRLAVAAFDPLRNRVVLYGGFAGTVNLFDTWEFDGATWTKATDSAPKLTSASLVWDDGRDEVLLLGNDELLAPQMYRFKAPEWEKITPAHIPPCVGQGAMASQTHNDRVAFVGGLCPNGLAEDDTWEWDGIDWTLIEASPTQGTVSGHAIAYDEERGNVVLFGGIDFVERNTTLTFRDTAWTQVADTFSPGPRSLFVFEGDPDRNVSWLFGGHNERGDFADLWKLENGTWESVTAEGGPTSCTYPLGSYDTGRQRLVILCEDSSTFEWDGEAWFKFENLDKQPPSRRFSMMTYDPRTKMTVMYGGYGLSGSSRSNFSDYIKETWLWDGKVWKKFDKKTTPPARMLGAYAYDPSSQKIVLFGGIGRKSTEDKIVRFSDTWTFDGSAWVNLKLTTGPTTRYGAQTATDPVHSLLIMFGGKNEKEEFINEQWEFTAGAWRKLEPAGPPSPRMNGGLVFDPSQQKMTLFAGYSGEYFSELWSVDGSTWQLIPEPDVPAGRHRATGR